MINKLLSFSKFIITDKVGISRTIRLSSVFTISVLLLSLTIFKVVPVIILSILITFLVEVIKILLIDLGVAKNILTSAKNLWNEFEREYNEK